MFNPCYPFTKELLEAMVKKEVVHFVRSTYKRGMGEGVKNSLLISHYHDPAEAQRHYNAIINDKHRFLYDVRIPEQLEKLLAAAAPPEGYKVFSRIMYPEIEKKVTTLFKNNTKRYLEKNTAWELGGRVTIHPHLYFQLGELYVRIAFEGDEIKIKFEELENS